MAGIFVWEKKSYCHHLCDKFLDFAEKKAGLKPKLEARRHCITVLQILFYR